MENLPYHTSVEIHGAVKRMTDKIWVLREARMVAETQSDFIKRAVSVWDSKGALIAVFENGKEVFLVDSAAESRYFDK